ncbi:hypothetical protein E4T52_04256 [Aureobasidium sp. EXF-3400]|nr:hypothetical protein E4T51_10334 [Aureobasidium sp. EXF-12344]KAI4780821.1 hypothetical protein E4T52_04256 [Aureobasidium sp. EXF-3400]
MLRINARGAVLTSIIALVLVLLFVAQWKRNEIETWRGAYAASTPNIANQDSKLDSIAEFKDDAAAPSPPDFTAANSTLGFQAILALSQGTKWRVDGLHAAAKVAGITVTVPQQPKWSDPFIKAFQDFGPIEAHGAAMAWLGHLDLLKFVIQNNWGSALILEDDMDWDIDIRRQTPPIAKAVRELTKAKGGKEPYGKNWDVLWMGHCSDPPPFKDEGKIITFTDNTTAPLDKYRGLNPRLKDVIKDEQRIVHYSINPVCTFAYAVSHSGARNLLAHASLGKGGAFDLMLMHACQDKVLKCVSVNPEVFDPYFPAEGGASEVRAGDAGVDFDHEVGKGMGHTDNTLNSARCFAQFGKTCLE